MSIYLSIDTEATGLKETTHLIQLALVPVDISRGKVLLSLGREWLVKCPTFEELEPSLDAWNLEHNRETIIRAHREGIDPKQVLPTIQQYLASADLVALFGNKRPVLLGKSLSALDIPLLKRCFGWEVFDRTFHHHTVDVTCVSRALVDAGMLPAGCESTSKLVSHFGIRDDARHTAMSDAVDMAEIYLKLLGILRGI